MLIINKIFTYIIYPLQRVITGLMNNKGGQLVERAITQNSHTHKHKGGTGQWAVY